MSEAADAAPRRQVLIHRWRSPLSAQADALTAASAQRCSPSTSDAWRSERTLSGVLEGEAMSHERLAAVDPGPARRRWPPIRRPTRHMRPL